MVDVVIDCAYNIDRLLT